MKNRKGESGNGFNLAKRLGAYSAVAAATAASTELAGADEVVWDIPDMEAGNEPGLNFNMLTGAVALALTDENPTPGSMRLIGNYAANANYPGAYLYTPGSSAMGAFVGSGGSNASLLVAGSKIDGDQNFVFNIDYPSIGNYANLNKWMPEGTRGFIGIRFQIEGATHYGWADITYNDALNKATLHAFGYNDTPGATSVPPAPPVLAITEVEYHPDAEPAPSVTLTWVKTEAESYIVKYSTDMTNWTGDLEDGITAAADENMDDEDHITVTLPLFELLWDEPDLFFRIEEQ